MQIIKKKLRLLYNRKKYNNEMNEISKYINDCNFSPVINTKPNKKRTITFVLPMIKKYGGGYTSVLRLGTQCHLQGFKVNYIVYGSQKYSDMLDAAKCNLPNFKGNLYESKHLYNIVSDIVVATNWQSVYYVIKMKGYKMYFVQDYEPYFHEYGEFFLLANKTYQMGLHMVSLGSWNKQMIQKNNSNINEIDVIDFPYESSEYYNKSLRNYNYKEKSTIKICVYIKEVGKRLPTIIQIILVNAKKEFEKKGIELDILFFGLEKDTKVIVGRNIGKLNKSQLLDLYNDSDFGMVASMTNISLIPYEMMACGLPVIEFNDGSFKNFFSEKCAILIDFNYMDLVDKIGEIINKPDGIKSMVNQGIEELKDISWEKTGMQFIGIINSI